MVTVPRPRIRRTSHKPVTPQKTGNRPDNFVVEEIGALMREMRLMKEQHTREYAALYERMKAAMNGMKKGNPGRDAPSLGVIVDAVMPRIRQPKDGKPPTKEELMTLILPLIPKVKDGKSPDVDTVARAVLARIKQPKFPVLGEIVNSVLDAIRGKLTIEDIKGLHTELRAAQSKAALGGGMGTIKFFKFECNGSTTEFQLPDIPTQEGAAVFAYYQGQRLHNNEHITVSGRTMTTTFTPDNGQVIDGWIIT